VPPPSLTSLTQNTAKENVARCRISRSRAQAVPSNLLQVSQPSQTVRTATHAWLSMAETQLVLLLCPSQSVRNHSWQVDSLPACWRSEKNLPPLAVLKPRHASDNAKLTSSHLQAILSYVISQHSTGLAHLSALMHAVWPLHARNRRCRLLPQTELALFRAEHIAAQAAQLIQYRHSQKAYSTITHKSTNSCGHHIHAHHPELLAPVYTGV